MTRRILLLAATIVTLAVIVGCQPGGPPVGRAPTPVVAEPDYWPTVAM